MTHAIAIRNFQSSAFRTWQVVDGELTNPQTYSTTASQPRGPDVTPDGAWLIYGQTADPYVVVRSNDDGTLGDNVAAAEYPDTTVNRIRISPTGKFVAVLHNDDGTGDYADKSLSVFSFADGTLARVASIGLGSTGGQDCAWNATENRLVVTLLSSWNVYLVSFDGESLAELASSNLGRSSDTANQKARCIWITPTRVAVGRQNGCEVADVSDDSFTVVQDNISGKWFTRASDRVIAPRPTTSEGAVAYQIAEGELTEVTTSAGDFRAVAAINDTGDLIVGSDGDGLNLYSYDGTSITLLDTGTFSSTVVDVLIWPIWKPLEPLTPEEEFNATYADASGRDPLPTMLVDGPSCQRAINTYTRFWAGVGEPLVVPVHVPLGELSLIEHGQVVVVKSQRHAIGLEQGRAAIVMRDRIDPRSGTCELTVMPSKQDIEE